MNLLGYLVTFANIQNFANTTGPIKNLSVKVAEVQTLLDELQKIPGLDIGKFRSTGYYRYGNLGKYLSKNLREYIFEKRGNPTDEGVILSLIFKDGPGRGLVDDDDTLSLFIHRDAVDNEVKEQVRTFLENKYGMDKTGLEERMEN